MEPEEGETWKDVGEKRQLRLSVSSVGVCGHVCRVPGGQAIAPAEEDSPERLSRSAAACALRAVSSPPLQRLESRLLGCQRPGDGSLG